MSFSVRLVTDLVTVEAGATVPVSIEVANKGAESDRYEVQIEGIDSEWTAIPEAVFVVEPGEIHTEKFFFKVPRASESQAGNYPYVVRVRSLNSGEAKTAQGVVQVKPFHYLTMEIGPKKGTYSPTRKQNVFDVTVLNLGNTTHTLHLSGSDPEEACAYEFESEQIQVSPGQERTVEVEVVPATTSFLSNSRLHGFAITGRSVENPSTIATAQAQLEQRPFLTPATLTFLVFLFIVVAAWFALLPKPPTVSLTVSRRQVNRGEPVVVTWRADNAKSVQVSVNGQPLVEGDPQLSGEADWVPNETGTVSITAQAFRDQRSSNIDTEQVIVSEPPPVPKPTVDFKAGRRQINLGETVELTYDIQNAVEAYLQPGPQKLPLQLKSVTVQPNKEGPNQYEIVATGADGQVTSAKVVVNVVDKLKVVILAFEAKPKKLDVGGGYVTISWQVSNAARVELSGGPEPFVPENPTAAGSQEFMVDKTTTFILKAIDENGRSISKSIRIEVAVPDMPPIDPATTGGVPPPVSTGATTGGQR